MQAEENCRHIGDGVYVDFDGYQFAIRVNDHRSYPVAFLEPSVMDALINYRNEILGPVKAEIPEANGYTKAEIECKGCMGPCGRCEDPAETDNNSSPTHEQQF